MNARIVLEFPQAPEAKEIELLVALAEKFPPNIDAYTVTLEHLDAIARVFEDEPTAAELCEMLTP